MTKYILVTGSSNGIGKEIAFKLIRNGFNVIFHGSNEEKLNTLKLEIPEGADYKIWVHDFSDLKINDKYSCFFDNIIIETVVLNAGIIPIGKLKVIDLNNLKKTLNINALSQIRLCEYLSTHSSLEFIYTISSLSTIYGFKGYSLYAGSKSILNHLNIYFNDSKLKVFSLLLGDIVKERSGLILNDSKLTNNLGRLYPFGLGSSFDVANIFFQLFIYRNHLCATQFTLDGGITNTNIINQ
jgi:17beta-estradiol 17-dehydrogenase / very-long-chain 3-oxoacyl-CoA reductase